MRLWFNKTFSSIHSVLRHLKQGAENDLLMLVLSHVHRHIPGAALVDEFYLEPSHLDDLAYVDWAVSFCREHQIDWFWPGKAAKLIGSQRVRFLEAGTQLVEIAEPEILGLLHNKADFYQQVPAEVAVAPESFPVHNLTEFDQAYELLRQKYRKVCVKPAVSVYGLGFRIIDEKRPSISHLLKGWEHHIPLEELRQGMAKTASFAPLLVMEYLPGHEWSVDCVAAKGELWCAIQRRKPQQAGYAQTIAYNPEIAGMVERLTRHYSLHGLFNIQFKEGINGMRLLEINPRPSGGVGMACLSGVNLAYLAWQAIQGQDQPDVSGDIVYGRYVAETHTPGIVLDAPE